MTGMPWGKWFWRDWMSDLDLQSCSLAAKGMWIDMLCVAGQSEPPGYVIIAGKTATDEDLARLCRVPLEEAIKLRTELEDRGIFSRNRAGTIYSRRIVRDHAKQQQAVVNGRKGGNPRLRNRKGISSSDIQRANHVAKYPDNIDPNARFSGDLNDSLTGGDKAQKPEARSQKPESPPATSSESSAEARAGLSASPKAVSDEDRAWIRLSIDIVAAFESANNPSLPDTGWLSMWRQKGYSPELCLAVVRDGVKRNRQIHGLKYFDGGLAEQHKAVLEARRQAEGLAPQAAGPDWDFIVGGYVKTSRMAWASTSPRPGFEGCQVPYEILHKHMPDEFPARAATH